MRYAMISDNASAFVLEVIALLITSMDVTALGFWEILPITSFNNASSLVSLFKTENSFS